MYRLHTCIHDFGLRRMRAQWQSPGRYLNILFMVWSKWHILPNSAAVGRMVLRGNVSKSCMSFCRGGIDPKNSTIVGMKNYNANGHIPVGCGECIVGIYKSVFLANKQLYLSKDTT